MNYALIVDGIVTNLIWLNPRNADDFPGAVPIAAGRPVAIGDTYAAGRYYRDGIEVLTPDETTIAELDAALLDMQYSLLTEGAETE